MSTTTEEVLARLAVSRRIQPAARSAHSVKGKNGIILPVKSKAEKRYHADRALLGKELRLSVPNLWHFSERFRLGVAVFLQPTKAGFIDQTDGDYDNFEKSVLDMLVKNEFVQNDNGRFYAGPGHVHIPAQWGIGTVWRPGLYLRPKHAAPCMPLEATCFTVWRNDDRFDVVA